jgi:hypothetical protein
MQGMYVRKNSERSVFRRGRLARQKEILKTLVVLCAGEDNNTARIKSKG